MVPREGFEPSVEDPKSSALPLGHPGAPPNSTASLDRPKRPVTSRERAAFRLVMRSLLVAGLLLVSAACGSYRFPGDSASPSPATAHVSGMVRSVPCAPVEQAGTTCAGRAVSGLEIDYMVGSTVVHRAVTDSKGAYSVDLKPGTYAIQLSTYMRVISGPTKLSLDAGSRIVADYVLDNGIRAPVPQQ